MLKFHQWLAEAPKKKKVTKEPKHTTTVVSAPLHGPNQDQSGFNTMSSTADYRISDA
jgi:predicted amidophosphoribosyltransferase